MAYTAGTITAGDTIAASWGNKVEDHLERLGNYMGVVDSIANLPDVATISDGDWYWCKAERVAKMNVGGVYKIIGEPSKFMLSDSDFALKCQDEEWATSLFNSHVALNNFIGGPFGPYLTGTLLKYSTTRAKFEANTDVCDAVMENIVYPRMMKNVLSRTGFLASPVLSAGVWRTSDGGYNTTEFFKAGSPAPPYTFYDGTYGQVKAEVRYDASRGYYLLIYQPSGRAYGTFTYSINIDFTDISALKIYTARSIGGNNNANLAVSINGTPLLFQDGYDQSWEEHIFDVSAFSGVITLNLSMKTYSNSADPSLNCYCSFGKITLVR